MHRFYLPPAQCHPPLLQLEGAEAHHARDVLRLEEGCEVVVLDGAGRQFFCVAREFDRHEAKLEVVRVAESPAPAARITLVQAIPKGKIFESIIQKATELGAAQIIPLLSERVTTRLDAEAAGDKAEKWRQTAIEAIKQCGQAWLPEVGAPVTLRALLAGGAKYELGVVGSLQGDGRQAGFYFEEFRSQHQRPPKSVCVWVGPEGDFAPWELDMIRAAGARPITMGPLVLRSETAALYALSVVNHELMRA